MKEYVVSLCTKEAIDNLQKNYSELQNDTTDTVFCRKLCVF